MTDSERDVLIIETNCNVKHLMSWTKEHRTTHTRYNLLILATLIGIIAKVLWL